MVCRKYYPNGTSSLPMTQYRANDCSSDDHQQHDRVQGNMHTGTQMPK